MARPVMREAVVVSGQQRLPSQASSLNFLLSFGFSTVPRSPPAFCSLSVDEGQVEPSPLQTRFRHSAGLKGQGSLASIQTREKKMSFLAPSWLEDEGVVCLEEEHTRGPAAVSASGVNSDSLSICTNSTILINDNFSSL